MKILLIDNYDSFTYNLVHILEKTEGTCVSVFKNNQISLDEVVNYDKILLSPGPGLPKDAGIMPQLIKRFYSTKPILGVCLGMQAIGEAFNAKLKNLETVMHGIQTTINLTKQDSIFEKCPQTFQVGRYHSWVIEEKHLPAELEITAIDAQNKIMAISHKTYNVKGVQFHPESILTEYGEQIISNWLNN